MEPEKCTKCNTLFDEDDPLKVQLELPCGHEVCTQCQITYSEMNSSTEIQCIICEEKFKFKNMYKPLIKAAESKLHARILSLQCPIHNMPIILVCRNDRRLLCRKCVLNSKYQGSLQNYIEYQPKAA